MTPRQPLLSVPYALNAGGKLEAQGYDAYHFAKLAATGRTESIKGDTQAYSQTANELTEVGVHGQAGGGRGYGKLGYAYYSNKTNAEPDWTYGIYAVGTKNYLGGSVGIGTDAPGAKLEIADAANPSFKLTRSDNNDGLTMGVGGTPYASYLDSSASQGIRLKTKGVDRMIINSSGFVGIGTTAPKQLLHLHNPGGAYLKVTETDLTKGSYFGQVGGNTVIQNQDQGNITIITGGTATPAIINSNGKFYIPGGIQIGDNNAPSVKTKLLTLPLDDLGNTSVTSGIPTTSMIYGALYSYSFNTGVGKSFVVSEHDGSYTPSIEFGIPTNPIYKDYGVTVNFHNTHMKNETIRIVVFYAP